MRNGAGRCCSSDYCGIAQKLTPAPRRVRGRHRKTRNYTLRHCEESATWQSQTIIDSVTGLLRRLQSQSPRNDTFILMQRKRKIPFLIIGALVLAGALLAYLYYRTPDTADESAAVKTMADRSARYTQEAPRVVHPATVMQADLYPSLESPEKVQVVTEKVYGGIVSHHFYMEPEIGKLFLELREQKPSAVVMVGPNHFNAGRGDILVSKAAYDTPFGTLAPASALADTLINNKAAIYEEDPFGREHSIGALVGFVKKVWPDTTLLPIIIKRTASGERVENLATELSQALPADALVLASVDFSHHLDRFAAEFHDSQSVSALRNADTTRYRSLEVDSPQSLEVLTRYLQAKGALRMQYTNTNQAIFSGSLLSDDVTSYVFAKFMQGKPVQDSTATFIHYGNFTIDALGAEEGKALYNLAGPEYNLLRGGDLKVAGTSSCDVQTIPALAPFKIQLFHTSKCADTAPKSVSLPQNSVGFVRVGSASSWAEIVDRFMNLYPVRVVQTTSVALAKQALDAGSQVAFVENSEPKVELYKNKPIIHIGKTGGSGMSAGMVFGERVRLYLFPYEIKNSLLVRPSIEERIEICEKVLPGLPGVDGCSLDIR
jgi:AmmeMemoRadiSam system protein B